VIQPDPVVLDSSFLLGYDRIRAAEDADLPRAQSAVAEWLVDRVPLIIPALSLLTATRDGGGTLPEVDFLLEGDPHLVVPVPLTRAAIADLAETLAKQWPGGISTVELEAWEVEHVLWCATGRDLDGTLTCWPVATYQPHRYTGRGVPLIAL
jgi:hypothetical protein